MNRKDSFIIVIIENYFKWIIFGFPDFMNYRIKIAIFFLLIFSGISQVTAQEYAGSSVLADGLWYKFEIREPGVVRINYNQLSSLGLPAGTVPAIYGNNFGLLSYMNDDEYPDDLVAVPVMVFKGADNVFNQGDYLLFYAPPTHRWNYSETEGYTFNRHYYSEYPSYFITWNRPAAEISLQQSSPVASLTSDFYDFVAIHEIEKANILKSGREWYEPVAVTAPVNFSNLFSASGLQPGEDIKFRIRVLARSEVMTSFRLNSGTSLIESIPVSEVNIFNTAGTYARAVTVEGQYNPVLYNQTLNLSYHNNGNGSARAWLDYLIIECRKKIVYPGRQFEITDSRSVSPGSATRFNLETSNSNLQVWDVSNSYSPVKMLITNSSGITSFVAETDSLRRFIAFDPQSAYSPEISSAPLSNQNLHEASRIDNIILTPDIFLSKAQELAAIHADNEGMVSRVVTLDQVYNEFSGGIADISAIRNYVRMVYTRNLNGAYPLRYLTLFGDGSFENRTLPPENPNYIPTYQTQNSHINILSFTSDDYYGLLDAGEGEASGYIDIGIGRLPVSDTIQANIMLSKIRHYISEEATGQWRNNILMIADDEDSNAHLNDAESLSDLIESNNPSMNIDKVYFDSYQQVTSINGESYPDATEAINRRVNSGCLIFNYLGHGNELGLAHERVVKVEDINSWTNSDHLPVFITATCEFSRFDDIELDPGTGEITPKPSAGEMVILNSKGGGIALLTTTRIVYSAPNYILNNRIYRHAFTLDENGMGQSLGDIVRLAKNDAGSGDNKRNFTLLGDPAVRLAYPWHGIVETDSVNSTEVSLFSDTLKALSRVTISGHIADRDGNRLTNFNGLVNTRIYDKKYLVSTLGNDGGTTTQYDRQDRILFRGKSEVRDGSFSIELIIPRDIDYTFGEGKISYYASSGSVDMTGGYSDLTIGGFSTSEISDTSGPSIRLFMNDTLFRDGGITDQNPVLLALIEDSGGINTAGSGIGHDIVGYLDDNRAASVVLNEYYENSLNSYTSGLLEYPLGKLERGSHSMSLKAWDNYNNSTTERLVFVVESDGRFILNDLVNYPNPFTTGTRINLEHNRPGTELEIEIMIFSSGGKIVKRINVSDRPDGYRLNPIEWDGLDESGSRVGRGIYIYSVYIKTSEGEHARVSGRMVIL